MDLHAPGPPDSARQRAPTTSAVTQGRTWPQQLGDRRPPRPPPRRGAAGVATREAPLVAADAAGGNAAAAGVAREDKGAAELGGTRRCFGLAEDKGSDEVGSKRCLGFASPRPYPPPKRRLVSARRRFPPGCGRDSAAPLAAPLSDDAARADGSSAMDMEVSAVAVSAPTVDKGHQCLEAEAGLSDQGAMSKSAPGSQPRSFSKTKEETKLGRCVTTNGSEDTAEFAKDRVVQAPTSVDKCLWTDREAAATSRSFFGPKKGNVKDKSVLPSNVKGDILKALAAREEKYGTQKLDARSKLKMMRTRFEFLRRAVIQAVKQHSLQIKRIDLAAGDLIRKTPGFIQHGPIIGKVPGVEVGDEFQYRVELNIVGLHRPYQGGIDSTRDEYNVLIAISVVASGGYPDELSSTGELVYTGSGGKVSGKKGEGNQKLERGNLALKNCIQTKTPVRVIHSFKGLNSGEGSHSRSKETPMFTYDGLYNVVDCWREGQPGSKVYKYKLKRIPGQAELPYGSRTAHRSKAGIMC